MPDVKTNYTIRFKLKMTIWNTHEKITGTYLK
jgi:hypothetical protein